MEQPHDRSIGTPAQGDEGKVLVDVRSGGHMEFFAFRADVEVEIEVRWRGHWLSLSIEPQGSYFLCALPADSAPLEDQIGEPG